MLRKTLSAPGLFDVIKKTFEQIPTNHTPRSNITLADCLMSGLAIFSLKIPSLLQFEHAKEEKRIRHNLKSLFQINQAPSDTYLRERLDIVEPSLIRKSFKKVFAELQRGNAIEQFSYIDGYYLLSLDGTGYFSSSRVHCKSCCVKKYMHTGEVLSFYHNMLGGVLIHPDYKEVIPLPPEPILQQDGNSKNDCEQHASKRMIENIRREHPHLKLIVVEDALSANGPHIQMLQKHKMRFIIGCKNFYGYLFRTRKDIGEYELTDENHTKHVFKFINNVSLNGSYQDIKVNVLDYYEINKKGKERHFTWITDLPLNQSTVYKIMKGGRARWKIENETFNTLKNQGYHFEHNYGHGYKNLTTVFVYLMMLAFLVDQVQQLCCKLFKAALDFSKTKIRFWEKIRGYFTLYYLDSWEQLYDAITYQRGDAHPNTS